MLKRMLKSGFVLATVTVAAAGFMAVVSQPAQAASRPINCKIVLCAYPDCGYGYHTEIPPGQCCPICVADK